eukprot:scaffold209901_cov25-Prasinocladus_malaysianus.AAC.1
MDFSGSQASPWHNGERHSTAFNVQTAVTRGYLPLVIAGNSIPALQVAPNGNEPSCVSVFKNIKQV